ncbi:hypothetical protein AQJ23_39185 [Streptomyces antibioticus]|nr:hypothetical protein [Streptomyces antibioticus]KUN18765.1 hypothetical protein AQJ23_39185 [Streptomyces antibioticus]
MNTTAALALSLPGTSGMWDFGDYPYALEPLTLPPPGVAWLPEEPPADDLRAACSALRDLAAAGDLGVAPAGEDELERLFWFRWITGHHISSLLWRLLAAALDRLGSPAADQAELSRVIPRYVRAYSAMLIYTGSSTQAIYNATIRPSMYRIHSTFSGTWSADFPAVRSLFRGRRVPPVTTAERAALTSEIELCHRIHLDVAAKLVTNGRSLLQHLVDNPAAHQPRVWSALFDHYFLTSRAPVSAHEVLSQLLRRCKAVAIDIASNGLYPAAAAYESSTPADPAAWAELTGDQELIDIVLGAAGLATGLIRP